MTTNRCTACKHHKHGHICGLTGHTTSKSRAYKTDKDDCFDNIWGEYDTNKAKEEQKKKMQEMTEQERREYLYGDFNINKDGK